MLRCIETSSLNGRLVGHPAIRSHSQSLSPFTKSFIFLKFPVFQSLKSASSITMPVLTLQHSSVLSVKRTRIKSKLPSSPPNRPPSPGRQRIGCPAQFSPHAAWHAICVLSRLTFPFWLQSP